MPAVIGGALIREASPKTIDPDTDGLLETSWRVDHQRRRYRPGQSFNVGTISGTYGDLTIDAAGNWTYAADNYTGGDPKSLAARRYA